MAESEQQATVYKQFLEQLSDAGYRLTTSRRALLRLLASARQPLSVQEIAEGVNATAAAERRRLRRAEVRGSQPAEAGDGINVVTVYRLVNLMVEMRLLRRVEFGQGYYRYERADAQDSIDHHHHLVCENCGRIEDFQGCADLAPLTDRVESEAGFKIQRHQLELYGTCSTCQRPGFNEAPPAHPLPHPPQ